MRILAAEDHVAARTILRRALQQLGHEVIETEDGEQAWQMQLKDPVRLIVSDWMMPRVDGLELCRRVRAHAFDGYVYFIMLTILDASQENKRIAAEAGVDDFLHKPLDPDELWTRLRTAERILDYASHVSRLERLLPICSFCKKIRDSSDAWQPIEAYIQKRTDSAFSHSVCPDCYQRLVLPQMQAEGVPVPPSAPTN